jgi:hypothetical protein
VTDLVEAAIEAGRVERLIASDNAAKGTPLREALATLLAREHFGEIEIFDVPAHTKDMHSFARRNLRASADRLIELGIADIFTPDRATLHETLRQARMLDEHGDGIVWVEQDADTLIKTLTDTAALTAATNAVRGNHDTPEGRTR